MEAASQGSRHFITNLALTTFRSIGGFLIMHATTRRIIVGLGFVAAVPSLATAALTLMVGGTTITDNLVGDLDPTTGSIGAFVVVGGFGSSITATTSKPLIGTTIYPAINIVSSTTSTGAGMLVIKASDDFFGPSPSPIYFTNVVNGSNAAGGTVAYASFIDTSNAIFGTGTSASPPLSGTGVFSADATSGNLGPLAAPYSITMINTLTHTTAQTTTFDATMRAIPEPASVVAWCGLACLGLIGVWKKSKSW
jgi:hypothetical protein